jgi:hypothetical protein
VSPAKTRSMALSHWPRIGDSEPIWLGDECPKVRMMPVGPLEPRPTSYPYIHWSSNEVDVREMNSPTKRPNKTQWDIGYPR